MSSKNERMRRPFVDKFVYLRTKSAGVSGGTDE